MLAIIGGSGLTELANLEVVRREIVRTPYGDPSGAITHGTMRGQPVAFLARHGYGHTIPPHKVNYRANIWALAQQDVKYIVSVASVGGIRADLKPGTLAIPDQIIDYTYGREFTYFNGTDRSVVHVDFTLPYC
jgi:5'-methylthioinosine phosphorylase